VFSQTVDWHQPKKGHVSSSRQKRADTITGICEASFLSLSLFYDCISQSECSPRGLIIHFARRRRSTIGSGLALVCARVSARIRPRPSRKRKTCSILHFCSNNARIEFAAKARGWALRNVGRFLGRAAADVFYTLIKHAINHCVIYKVFNFFWGNVFNLLKALK
jgi:hypothetical protein